MNKKYTKNAMGNYVEKNMETEELYQKILKLVNNTPDLGPTEIFDALSNAIAHYAISLDIPLKLIQRCVELIYRAKEDKIKFGYN